METASNQAEPTQEQLVSAIYEFAAELMEKGTPVHQIEQELIDKGLDADSAYNVVRNLQEARREALRGAGQKNMLFGALWCAGGTVVTVGTLMAASEGGTFIVAWGAILFGAVQFFQGVSQLGRV